MTQDNLKQSSPGCGSSQSIGLLCMLAAAVTNALQQSLLKKANADEHLPVQEMLVARVAVGFFGMVLPSMLWKAVPVLPEARRLWPFILGRGICGGSCMVAFLFFGVFDSARKSLKSPNCFLS
eukprot:TRINITY_DN54692_c0_g1_i3.p1 TRINITY_DN54692_c0_g1~~TRINITY_DN54692_c0_g1_i3.p1  ORF type:complete len:123 (-),score=22.34 TRINITY_DN54692_c0_g1_i3:5-373(-)